MQTAKVLYGIDLSLSAPHVTIDPWDVPSLHWHMGNMQVKYVRHTLAEMIIPRVGKVWSLHMCFLFLYTRVGYIHNACIL
jgi:hypothetical protein